MNSHLSRREVLRLFGGVAAGCVTSSYSLAGQTSGQRRLGVCSISYALRWPTVDRGQAGIEEVLHFIDYCHELGAGGVQTTIRTEAGFSRQMRAKVEEFGMYLEGQIGLPRAEQDIEVFEAKVHAAKDAGATVLRTACLGGRRYETFKDAEGFSEFARKAEQSLEWAKPVVQKHQVRLAVENHKDWRIPELLGLIQRLNSEYIGICVDTGNSISLLEDPVAVVEAYAPYAFATHLKDMAVQEYERGILLAEVPLGTGFLDLPRIVEVLRRARPEVQFSLEMITRDPLRVPCLTKEYWATFETLPGWFLAGTLSMVRGNAARNGIPKVSTMTQEEKLELEDQAVHRSLAYARKELQL
jgi:hypothetical protein